MELILVVVGILLAIIVLGLLVWLASVISFLRGELKTLKTSQDDTSKDLRESIQTGQYHVSQSILSGQKILSQLNSQIGELHGTNKQMLEVGNEVKRLQNILSSPKLRGQMGERSLENMLSLILPKDSYTLQHTFKDGKIVDALVQLTDFSVSIDAKFPLPAFENIVKVESEEEKIKLRKQLARDLTKHIDKIASGYIRPTEGTLDFAIMYIPAENIYYETVVRYSGETKDILQYALDKKVIPVSPNLLYAYLMTIVMGLHGMQIEEQAAQIHQNLKKLNASFASYCENWDVLGKHLRNAQSQYDCADKKLSHFGSHLERIQGDGENQ